MSDILTQLFQAFLVLALAPALTGWVRLVKARLVGRRGASILQPYRDLARLLRKEVVLAHEATWLFRAVPSITFAALWLAATLVPTFSTELMLDPTADLIALIALLGAARFFLALAGMDVGTAFGGLGSSREIMIAAFAEPAMLLVVFSVAILVKSTALTEIARHLIFDGVGLRVTLALALLSLMMVAIAENARIPVDNPSTHLELTMVHEAMILEYSGRHLALIEAGAMVKLLLYISLIACVFVPWGLAGVWSGDFGVVTGLITYLLKLATGGALLGAFEVSVAKMRVFRVGEFLGSALLLSLMGAIFLYVSRGI